MADTALPDHFPGTQFPVDKAEASGTLDANGIIANAPDPIFVSDLEGIILHANDAVCQLLGLRPGEPLGQSLTHRINNEEARECLAALREVVTCGVSRSVTLHPRNAVGEVIPVMLHASALRDHDGSVIGAIGIMRDMRAYERVVRDLEQAQADLQEAQEQRLALEEQTAQMEQAAQQRARALVETMRAKDEFLSIASHELKTPLTTMKLLIQLAQRELARANAPKITHIDRMGRSIVRMEELINDLLDVSRIDSGNLVMRPAPCNLAALCQQIAEEQAAANSRVITFVAQGPPAEMRVDGERIGQVVTNLLSNALKYSPAPEAVSLTFVQEEEAGIICVRDKGPGISADALPHIFERFYRVPGIEAQNGSGRGLGLGLHLCQEIVQRHGGQIWAESTVGSGTNFYLALPVAGPFSNEERCPSDETTGSEAYQPHSRHRAES